MATNRELRAALLDKLGVSKQRLSQLVNQVKRLYGPMSTEEATYVLAHQESLDLTKYLETSMVDRIRSMLPKGAQVAVRPPPKRSGTRPKQTTTRPVRIAPSLEVVDAMLSPAVAEDATRMASIYPKLYVLENSLRSVIGRVLVASYGKDWWSSRAPNDVKKRVQGRKDDEDKKPWHGKRGSHEIYYSDFGDLRRLIVHNWDDFKSLFPTQQWITQKLEELEPPRNVLAHNNPISKQDETRIALYSDDWVALLSARREFIP